MLWIIKEIEISQEANLFGTYIADEPLMNSMADPPRSEIGCILISTSLFFLFISFLIIKQAARTSHPY
jgi:hypothetical protein